MPRPDQYTFVWFTFNGDAKCLTQSVRSVRAAVPGAGIVIAEDQAAPLPEGERERYVSAGAEYITTTWNRNGNLNGLATVSGQLSVMAAAAAARPDARVILKIDSDTVVNSMRYFDKVDWTKKQGAAPYQPSWWWQGPLYAIAAEALPTLCGAVADCPRLMPELAPHWPEDQTVGRLMVETFGPERIANLGGFPVGTAIAHYEYRTTAQMERYHEFAAVSFGLRKQLTCPESMRRDTAADYMESFLNSLAEPASVPNSR